MSDRIGELQRSVKRATAAAVGFLCLLIIWLVSPQWRTDTLDALPQWGNILIWFVPLVLAALAWYFVMIDTHNLFDRMFFRQRERVDSFIRDQLTSPCRGTSCDRAKRGIPGNEERGLMNLFYTFIPADDTEREHTFAYWTEYFITVNLSVFSILGVIVASTYVAIAYYYDATVKIGHSGFIAVVLIAVLSNLARFVVKRRLMHPAEAQTKRILTDDRGELVHKLPNYRYGCGECPLGSSDLS